MSIFDDVWLNPTTSIVSSIMGRIVLSISSFWFGFDARRGRLVIASSMPVSCVVVIVSPYRSTLVVIGIITASWIMLAVMAAPRLPMRVRFRYMPAVYVIPVMAPSVMVNGVGVVFGWVSVMAAVSMAAVR